MPQHTKLGAFRKDTTQDVYSFGLVVFQIAANGAIPFRSESSESHLPVQPMQLPTDIPGELLYIVTGTTSFIPTALETVEQKLQGMLTRLHLTGIIVQRSSRRRTLRDGMPIPTGIPSP
jgi:hypothetical protein